MNRVNLSDIDNWNIKFRPMFGKAIKELAEKNEDIVLVVADSGRACRCDGFERCPEQFVDCGIAEQNMTGVAAGLARGGKKPVTFAFAPFASERCFEQVRLDVAYSELDVVIVGSEGGVGMGTQGVTHFGWEDIAVMSSLPGMTVFCPADNVSMISLLERAIEMRGPVYLRMNGGIPECTYEGRELFEVGSAVVHERGADVNFIVAGPLLSEVLKARDILSEEGISAGVVDMFCIKPVDENVIMDMAKESKVIVTVEEHSVVNGLGSVVANILAAQGYGCRLVKLGLPDEYPHTVSPYEEMLKEYRLTAEDFAAAAKKALGV